MEYSGEVLEVGAAVNNLSPGDKVYVDGFTAGPRSYGKYQTWGGMATYSVAPAASLRTVPHNLTMHQVRDNTFNTSLTRLLLILLQL